ncbi:hypothetical protein Acr_00g0040400 [Actinidia rufa]|uniref:Uncharacterized protein n=1 Tax=Actinidia rufa TaxID=165716 RepID=A0A7J0DHU5_9ERIC|nr:hypothetical protein Acr_00g0016640 [Actinidia rufa]GFS35525.1 hypothetical protein Acr_00g0040400 [Actinidia rufa]
MASGSKEKQPAARKDDIQTMAAIACSCPRVLPGLSPISVNPFSKNQNPLPFPTTPGTNEYLLGGSGNGVSHPKNPITSNGGTGTNNFNPFSRPSQSTLPMNPNLNPNLQPINPPNPQLVGLVAL